MNYTGAVYRPPYEAQTLLLQVTVGCARNKCTFCTMYKNERFMIEPIEQIEKDLKEAKSIYKDIRRIFLVNGDAFVLSARRLKIIAKKIIEYFPTIETITMYASINNIKMKSDDELKELKKLRIDQLWVGVESGREETLKYHNKGYTKEEARFNLKRLKEAGISFYFGMMFGAAGSGRCYENAIETAKMINETSPIGVVPTTLSANRGSLLECDVRNGLFELATEKEIFEEMKALINNIELEKVEYLGRHIINTIPFDAILQRDKEAVLNKIDEVISNMDEKLLNSVPKRHTI